jgi:hypothetical protein
VPVSARASIPYNSVTKIFLQIGYQVTGFMGGINAFLPKSCICLSGLYLPLPFTARGFGAENEPDKPGMMIPKEFLRRTM